MDISSLIPYLPIDRRHALAGGYSLPDRVHGAALFADISGFTPLTGALATELGRQRGAEKVLDYINPIYEAVIARLYEYRGSVICFAGDSITCWLDGDDGRRGVACALDMQGILARLGTVTTPKGTQVKLSIKIAVAAGPARRFLAGDPQVHNFEALAGATLERMAAAEHQAEKGDVVVSQEVADSLGDSLALAGWRAEEETGRVFAVVPGLAMGVETDPWPPLPAGALSAGPLRPWIDAPVYERLSGGASYLAELRPVTSIFAKFGGIDYDGDDQAGQKLDAYIRWVESVLARYEGTMLQLTIGDKGSNLLAAFGAPVAHDDDEARAVAAALDLQAGADSPCPYIPSPQVGVSSGLAWAGACGGRLRCIYTVMGDEVNMAARLMGKAKPGQVLVNQHVADATARRYRYNSLGEIAIKGRERPLPVSEALGRQTAATHQLAALFASPLVGREDILSQMNSYLAQARAGQGQVLRLEGAAGVGKSHLAAVFASQAAEAGWRVVVGSCQSITQGTAYTPWKQAFLALLGIGEAPAGEAPGEEQVEQLTAALVQARPDWEPRIPLLGDLLGLPVPDNPVTAALEPKLRQQAMFALAAEILQVWAARQPLLLLLEDLHWLDEASAGLTLAVARAIGRTPCLLLAVQRPPLQADQPILPDLDHLGYYHFIQLGDLAPEGVAALVSNRLRGPLSPLVGALVVAQAQGNPFFTEELVDALREAGYIQPDREGMWALSEAALAALIDGNCIVKVEGEWRMVDNPPLSAARLDIPDSVQGTVLARMDRLPESHKLTLKVASVIGRAFGLGLLQEAHPASLPLDSLRQEIEAMGERDFVRLEVAAPEPVYIFKHNTTQEVAYGTLLFAQRQELHAKVARWHERTYGGDAPLDALTLDSPLAPHYPILVHHWHNAENGQRERAYAGLAGQQAAKQYANEGAVRYFSRALDLTPEADLGGRYKLLLGREDVNNVLAKREMQAQDLAVLSSLATASDDDQKRAVVNLRQAMYANYLDDYPAGLEAVQQAVTLAVGAQDQDTEARGYHEWGRLLAKQGEYEAAIQKYDHALKLTQATHNRQEQARCLYDIATVYYQQTNYTEARVYYQQAQVIYQEVGYRPGETLCWLMFGELHYQLGNYMATQANFEQALALSRSIGTPWIEAHILGSLGNNAFDLGDYHASQHYHQQAFIVSQEIGYRYQEAVSLDTLSLVSYILDDNETAQNYSHQAISIQQDIGDRRSQGYTLNHLGLALVGSGDVLGARDAYSRALNIRRELGQAVLAMDDLAGLARVALAQGNIAQALTHVDEILAWLTGNSPDGIEFPVWVYLTCHRVLRAAAGDDPSALERAHKALDAGYKLLQERAGRIQDEALRRQFLENVPWNRELVAEWEEEDVKNVRP
ncbi:MAG: AAA family ATPase [Thermoflexales bacterium]|nr:AAA family ATPase [Thermoflexales bacterium]